MYELATEQQRTSDKEQKEPQFTHEKHVCVHSQRVLSDLITNGQF